jgi:hypothetical protein
MGALWGLTRNSYKICVHSNLEIAEENFLIFILLTLAQISCIIFVFTVNMNT